jgi:hypothetical protein
MNPQIGNPGLVALAGKDSTCKQLVRRSMKRDDAGYHEDLLQALVAHTPSLLPIRDFLPSTTSVISLATEVPLDVGGKTGYIDNLLITNEGRLVLVETKLWSNPESTREVIAQVLQYGMALTALSLRELESRLRLPGVRTVREFAAQQGGLTELVEDFDDAIERHLRRGELLYFIVADGISTSVERLAHWLDEAGSAPFKLGLVELRLFDTGDERVLVVPRTLIKTREISRHVVTVDIRTETAVAATATVTDELKPPLGPVSQTQRPVKVAGPAITRESLVTAVKEKSGEAAAVCLNRILDLVTAAGLDSTATASTIQYGLIAPPDDSVFHSILALTVTGAWSHPPYGTIDIIGDGEFVNHKVRMNKVAAFYREDDAKDPGKRRHELIAGYLSLAGKEAELVKAVCETREVIARELEG